MANSKPSSLRSVSLLENLEIEFSNKKDRLSQELEKVRAYEGQNEELKTRISVLEGSYYEQDRLIKELHLQNQALTTQNKSLNNSLIETTETIMNESRSFRKQQTSKTEKNSQIIKNLQKENERIKREKSKLQELIASLTSEIETLKIENKNLEGFNEDLELKLKSIRQSYLQIKNENEPSIKNLDFETSMNNIPENESYLSAETTKFNKKPILCQTMIQRNRSTSRVSSLSKSFKLLEKEAVVGDKNNLIPKTSKLENNSKRPRFRQYAYLYMQNFKNLVVMYCSDSTLTLYNYGDLKSVIMKLPLESIISYKKSLDNPHLNEIRYARKDGDEVRLILEIYPVNSFIDFISQCPNFSTSNISLALFHIENKAVINNTFFNILADHSICGFLDIRSSSFWVSWKPVFAIVCQTQLFIFALPQQFKYHCYKEHTRNLKTFSLKNSRITEKNNHKKGDELNFTLGFSENEEILLRACSLEEYSKWVNLLKYNFNHE